MSIATRKFTPSLQSCLVRGTAARKGPMRTVSPRDTSAKHLHHGYPNVAAPGGSINVLWMMAANRETEDPSFGVVNVHPDFRQTGSGLDAGKAAK